MAKKIKGASVETNSWAKHLRKIGKRIFWSANRVKSKNDLHHLKYD